MLAEAFAAIKGLFAPTAPWAMVSPWEQAIRVRFGKYIKSFGAGIHFKIPFFDRYYIQSVRTRISDLGRQTLSTADGKGVTVSGVVEYEILDLEALYQNLQNAEDTIINYAKSELISRIAVTPAQDVSKKLEYQIEAPLLSDSGINVRSVRLTDCAVVRTYRIIGDKEHWGNSDNLDTDAWTN